MSRLKINLSAGTNGGLVTVDNVEFTDYSRVSEAHRDGVKSYALEFENLEAASKLDDLAENDYCEIFEEITFKPKVSNLQSEFIELSSFQV